MPTPIPTHTQTVMGLLNSFFWLCYGIALMDMIIFFPNATGFLLGIIQLVLCTLFPNKHFPQSQEDSVILHEQGVVLGTSLEAQDLVHPLSQETSIV